MAHVYEIKILPEVAMLKVTELPATGEHPTDAEHQANAEAIYQFLTTGVYYKAYDYLVRRLYQAEVDNHCPICGIVSYRVESLASNLSCRGCGRIV